ncbi:MAG: carbohydrate kinase, partial [Polyangiaceae bacterium]|nr:carbohydrate kinase [Polyangiaceae bacterium]
IPIEPYFAHEAGYAEQEPDVYFDALCRATRGLFDAGIDPRRVAGVAVTTQRGTVIAVDHEGRPLRPALTWLDQREATRLPPLPAHLALVFRAIGEAETVAHLRRQAEVNWIAYHEPEVWARTAKVILLSGYHVHRLTGRFADSIGSQVAYLPFDYKRQRWCAPWEWQWQAMAVRRRQLPDLVKPGTRIGAIHAEAARRTRIPEGTPVFAAGADKACEVLGSGCLSPEIGCISYGTTATINAASPRYIEPVRLLPAYPAAVPDAFNVEVQVHRGFWMVQWFKEQFGSAEVQAAEAAGVSAEHLFDEMIRELPPGSMGLTLQPYWTPGIRTPGREAKGAIIGFGDVHTRAHFYRAILEGLAYGLRDGAERIE